MYIWFDSIVQKIVASMTVSQNNQEEQEHAVVQFWLEAGLGTHLGNNNDEKEYEIWDFWRYLVNEHVIFPSNSLETKKEVWWWKSGQKLSQEMEKTPEGQYKAGKRRHTWVIKEMERDITEQVGSVDDWEYDEMAKNHFGFWMMKWVFRKKAADHNAAIASARDDKDDRKTSNKK